MREKCVTVPFKFDPAVLRYLELIFNINKELVDLRKSIFYPVLVNMLTRIKKSDKNPSPSCCSSFIETNIVIKEWDYSRNGEFISDYDMIQFNNLIYKFLIREACYRIMIAHVFSGIPRDTCIRDYIFEVGYKEDELRYDALRKYYQRNWICKEKEFIETIDFSLSENGYKRSTNQVHKEYKTGTEIYAKNVPMGFRY